MLLWRKTRDEEGWKWHVCFYVLCGARTSPSLFFMTSPDEEEIKKNIFPQQRQPKPYSLAAIFHKSITFVNYLLTTAPYKGSLFPLNFRDRPKWETVLGWHPASKKKTHLSLMWTPPESEWCFRCWAQSCPMVFPRQGHRLEWAAPSRWAIPPYNSSVQKAECTPFVIQPFNFFQMFPNKQQNKIKDFFSSTTKPNGPNFPSL